MARLSPRRPGCYDSRILELRAGELTEILKGEGLLCERGGRPVFARLHFALAPGSALVLKGPNGSGKSSLLRLCAGLIRPSAGRLLRGGRPVDDDPDGHRADLRYMGHLPALKPALTLRRNLEHWAMLYGVGDPVARVEAALSRVRLGTLADLPARLLSAGQQRRAAIARLLLQPASLWLMDEPTVGLDARSLDDLTRLMAEHVEAGGAIMVATHQPLDLPSMRDLDLSAFRPEEAFT